MTSNLEQLRYHAFSEPLQPYCSYVISGEKINTQTSLDRIRAKMVYYLPEDLAAMILATNPILESFGNAKTMRNNNSSRFGKFLKIMFESSKITGAQIDNYLLEKTQIVLQAPTERNYHIFYLLIRGTTPEEKEKYKLKNEPENYHYLTNGNIEVDGIDDVAWWFKTMMAFKTLNFIESDIDLILWLLSAILNIGNTEFTGTDKVSLKNEEQVNIFCDLMEVNKELTTKSLLGRQLQVGGETILVPLTLPKLLKIGMLLQRTCIPAYSIGS